LLDLFRFGFGGKGMTQGLQARIDKTGVWGAGILGILFALAFCPTSAGLFFGGLIPLAVKNNSAIALPAFYGVGTALPVFGFALLIAFGAHLVGTVFNKLTVIDLWVRRAMAVIFLGAGVYLTLAHTLALV
ncbi:MAG: sulfite exporter TauE/SafE family protein, partial [Pseudomonadota bacterium]